LTPRSRVAAVGDDRLRQRHRAHQHGDPEVVPDQADRLALHRAGQAASKCFAERFIGRLRDQCLNETIFTSLAQACAMLATWRHDHNTARPYSGLGFQTPGRVCRLGKPRTGQGG